MVYLLECLQKTPPPVIVFSENKNEVDGKEQQNLRGSEELTNIIDIQEYLLLKGVEAVAIHGSKSTVFLSSSIFDIHPCFSPGRTIVRNQGL